MVYPAPRNRPGESSWRSRPVKYWDGDWDTIKSLIPVFDLRPFTIVPEVADRAPFEPGLEALANPFLQVVMRRPGPDSDLPMPVGVVSRTYTLVQYLTIAALCRDVLLQAGIGPGGLKYELALSELGEWMNLRIQLPESYKFVDKRDEESHLRLECFNSVDGSSPLELFFRWYRLVCENGQVTEDKIKIRRRHGQGLRLYPIRSALQKALNSVRSDRERMRKWEQVKIGDIEAWTWEHVAPKWNKTAAARVFYICTEGRDVEIAHPFRKPSKYLPRVPGSPEHAESIYDVSQALSFVATRRRDVEERVKWQEDIPPLLEELPATREVELWE
ncbi:MAG: DUF932 domain-containing protein [Gemmatimonadota bacterium]|nr:DUF932 domain-containing protein [Gemmatimonadota bacterium]